MSSPPTLEAEDLGLRYGEHLAFEGVTLALPAGAITAIVGPSGCGKTSFLRCLNRLVDLEPRAVVSGAIRVDGADVLDPGLDVVAHRRRVGMIFQRPNPFPLSVRENLALPLREHGAAAGEVEDRTRRALEEVGLWEEVADRLDAPARELSGGQAQRLCIARALALGPAALLFDEPCSQLDPLSAAVVEDLIASLRGRHTVVVVTHNLAQARRIADHAALFWHRNGAGRLIEAAPADRFFEAPEHELTRAYVRGERG